ncbi:MAG TPA: TolC family protein [Ferruginibacter sp.]|jgi:outer membrane protein TolC|nr:TolC family protein [Ferruginibacter sp.]
MKKIILLSAFVIGITLVNAQTMELNDILDSIQQSHPSVKMYDANIRSMDAAAKGAKNWEAPEISTGLWMTPYNTNLWKENDGNTGMGQYMISGEQMFPNKKYNDANAAYMNEMSASVKEEKKNTLNELFATAKKSYYEWAILIKKLHLLDEDDRLLQMMQSNAETRYKNGLGKISVYYKVKAALANIESQRIMIQNDLEQKRIALNTLMNRNSNIDFAIDTASSIKDYSSLVLDTSLFYTNRSDIRSIDKNIQLTYLKEQVEKESLKTQFGIQYAHMFGFGGLPAQFTLMGTIKIPMVKWSSRANKANVESLQWQAVALQDQKVMMANEYVGMANSIQNEIVAKKKEVTLFQNDIIPALKKNYQSMELGYEQNTEELFMLYDAWQTLNDTEMEYFDQLQQLMELQTELERVLEIK